MIIFVIITILIIKLFFLLRYILFIYLAFAFCFCSSHLKKRAASCQTSTSEARFWLQNTSLVLSGGRRGTKVFFSSGQEPYHTYS